MRKEIEIGHIPVIENLEDREFLAVMTEHIRPEKVGCVNWAEYSYVPEVDLRLAFSDNVLALLYTVKEEHILGSVLDDNGPVWEDSCVETFIKDPLSDNYYNFEINCIATRLAALRRSRTDCDLFSAEKLSKIRCFSSLPHEKTDTINTEQKEWNLALMIPFSLLGLDKAPDYLDVNFYKCGDNCRQPHYLSWSPIELPEPNFHCPEFFGRINLIKK